MPTIPKKIQPPDPHQIPITLGEEDFHSLCECVEIDWEKDPEQARGLKAQVEFELSHHFNMLRRQSSRPLPAQMKLQIKQIEARASELADLLDPGKLPIQILRELRIPVIDDGHVMLLLREIAMSAEVAVDRLSTQLSSGMHVKRFGEVLASVREAIERLFIKVRPPASGDYPEEYEAAKAEFVRRCRKYLPSPPTARKGKSSPEAG